MMNKQKQQNQQNHQNTQQICNGVCTAGSCSCFNDNLSNTTTRNSKKTMINAIAISIPKCSSYSSISSSSTQVTCNISPQSTGSELRTMPDVSPSNLALLSASRHSQINDLSDMSDNEYGQNEQNEPLPAIPQIRKTSCTLSPIFSEPTQMNQLEPAVSDSDYESVNLNSNLDESSLSPELCALSKLHVQNLKNLKNLSVPNSARSNSDEDTDIQHVCRLTLESLTLAVEVSTSTSSQLPDFSQPVPDPELSDPESEPTTSESESCSSSEQKCNSNSGSNPSYFSQMSSLFLSPIALVRPQVSDASVISSANLQHVEAEQMYEQLDDVLLNILQIRTNKGCDRIDPAAVLSSVIGSTFNLGNYFVGPVRTRVDSLLSRVSYLQSQSLGSSVAWVATKLTPYAYSLIEQILVELYSALTDVIEYYDPNPKHNVILRIIDKLNSIIKAAQGLMALSDSFLEVDEAASELGSESGSGSGSGYDEEEEEEDDEDDEDDEDEGESVEEAAAAGDRDRDHQEIDYVNFNNNND